MKVLIISWGWPPIGRIGTMRPLGLAREWTRLGHQVHVLTGPGDRGGEYCPDLIPAGEASGAVVHRADAGQLVRPTELQPAWDMPEAQRVQRRPISRLRQVLGQWKGFPDLQRTWIAPARKLGRSLDLGSFDVLFSTSPPESVHFVARDLARAGVPWVADLRDQWSDYLLARWDPLSRSVIDIIARRVLGSAAAVTAATEGVARSMERAIGRPVLCIRNGFDPVPLSSGTPRTRVLGYFGRIDPLMQKPERLWGPLRALKAQGRTWQVLLYSAPGGGGGALVEIPADLKTDVQVLPPVPQPEALQLMQEMTALLYLGWEARGGEAAVGGKVYEYIGASRPVLACAPEHYEVRRLIERSGLGVGGWGEDELVTALGVLEVYQSSAAARLGFSREVSAEQMLRVLATASPRRASITQRPR